MMMTAMSCSLMMFLMLSQVVLKTMVFLLVATRYEHCVTRSCPLCVSDALIVISLILISRSRTLSD